ncbi:hypothetical protein DM02DRAFT_616514 [Periconia macrospinosa]|uniref:Uncharacterized protein n=1 Tax=Periconia macrospinosa TaxID=97972 RepID=A0A2V1DH65_9PLEO|nr:hypothetical protein DM02DRAFT_616514 [Periconia macrospinosa]
MSKTSSSQTLITDPASIAKYNRGPITTLFKQPTSCLSTLTQDPNKKSIYAVHGISGYFDQACLPLGILQHGDVTAVSAWWTYYNSPAICPSGWTEAVTFSKELPVNGPPLQLGSDTSAVCCCPPSFTYPVSAGNGHACASMISQSQVINYISPIPRDGGGWNTGEVSQTSFSLPSSVAGHGIVVMWQKSDESALKAAAETTTSASASQTLIPSPTKPSDSQTKDSNDGLSTGSKIGIGVVVVLVIVIVGAIIFLLWLRKARAGPANRPAPVELSAMGYKYEVPATSPSYELPGSHDTRAANNWAPHELR